MEMMAREEILARIRAANGTAPVTVSPAPASASAAADEAYSVLPRDYLRAHHNPAATDIVALFAERAADYRAVVERIGEDSIPAAIARAVATRGAVGTTPSAPTPPPADGGAGAGREDARHVQGNVLVPEGLPAQWLTGLAAGTEVVRDDPPLTPAHLDRVGAVVTGCAVAIAETGTVVLDHGPGQGRRALTLVPDFHVVVVRAGQVAADIADAVARLDASRPLTFVSGPSATSDIELIRVEGVHGPRTLHILVAGPLASSGDRAAPSSPPVPRDPMSRGPEVHVSLNHPRDQAV